MTIACFGDFAHAVSAHLEAAAVFPDGGLADEPAASAARQAGRLAATLSHYLADIAPYDEVEVLTSERIGGWAQAAADAREALQVAAASLHPAAADPVTPEAGTAGQLSAHLGAAAMSLAAGRDLLRTHFSTGADGPSSSEWSSGITSAPVTRALLDELARWSQQLALLTGRMSVMPTAGAPGPVFMPQGMASACHWLLVAAATIRAGTHGSPLDAGDTELLMAIPVNVVARRSPPAGPETAAELCAGIEASASRLRALTYRAAGQAAWSPGVSADSWRWVANGAAVTCHISEQMLTRLADQERQGGPPGAGMQFGSAAKAMGQASARWREVVAVWNQMTTESTGLAAVGIADMSDIVVRVGRLAFEDPEWVPDRSRRAPLRDAGELAPDIRQATMVVGAIHHLAETSARLAAADLDGVRLAGRAGRLYVPTRTLPEEYDVPYRFGNATPADIRDLLDAYGSAVGAAGQALTALDRIAITLEAPSRVLVAARVAPHRAPFPYGVRGAQGQRVGGGPAPSAKIAVTRPRAPGPVEHTLHKLGITDSVPLLRAMAIDKAAGNLTDWARASVRQRAQAETIPAEGQSSSANAAARVAGENFPGVRAVSAGVNQVASSLGRQTPTLGSSAPSCGSQPGLRRRPC